MKTLTIIILSFISFTCFAQTDTIISYSAVVKVDSNLKATELYTRARAWLAESYRDSKAVLEVEDKENGQLIGKGSMKYAATYFYGSNIGGIIRYHIKIFVKDGRYKYEFSNFTHGETHYSNGGTANFGLLTSSAECPKENRPWGWGGAPKMATNAWADMKLCVDRDLAPVIESLKAAMAKPASKSDW